MHLVLLTHGMDDLVDIVTDEDCETRGCKCFVDLGGRDEGGEEEGTGGDLCLNG